MNPNEKVELLKTQGYEPVYVWDATPGEEDPEHSHEFDTHLVILDGELTLTIDGAERVLKEGNELDIPRNQTHAAVAGERGCSYIVAEMH